VKKKPLLKFLTAACLAAVLLVSTFLTSCCGVTPTGRLVAGFTDAPTTFNPFWSQRYPSTAFTGLIYEPLFYAMEDGSIEPALATDWAQGAGGLEYTININPKAKWSDGTAVTADDVIFTYQLHWEYEAEWSQARNNKALLKMTGDDPATDALTKISDLSVKFKLRDTFSTQIFLTTLSTVFICPEHIWEPKIAELAALTPPVSIEKYAVEEEALTIQKALLIGSGPFLYEEYASEEYMVYKTNTNYWTGTSAKIDEVVFKIYADPQVATLALRSGEVDCLPMIETPTEVATLLTDKNIEVDIIENYNSTIMFFLNMRYAPLNVLNVRKAIDMALNKPDMITFGAFGYGTLPSQVPFPPGLAESNNDITWEKTYVDGTGTFKDLTTRVADANALLDAVPGMSTIAAGVDGIRTYVDPNGVPQKVTFEGLYRPSPTYQRMAELVAEDMEEIGIEIVPTVETGAFGPKVFGGQVYSYETIIFGYPGAPEFDGMVKQWGMPTYGANYDGSVVGFNQNPDDPYINNGAAKPGAADGPKIMTYDTPDWDTATVAEKAHYKKLYEDLLAMANPIEAQLRATRTMADPAARLTAVKAAQAAFAAQLPVVNLYHPQYMSAYREDRFEGWDVEGIFLYGFMPPTTSVTTLMGISAISAT